MREEERNGCDELGARGRFTGALPYTNTFVDNFPRSNSGASRAPPVFFLTHFHSDHYGELLAPGWGSGKIYCSSITRDLLLDRVSINKHLVIALEEMQQHVVDLSSDGSVRMAVTLIPARSHCPGAVMFLFDGFFGRYLHTGDFRYDEAMREAALLPLLRDVDVLFMDTTFADRFWAAFPEQRAALQQIVELIEKRAPPPLPVYVDTRGMLGTEALLAALARHFRCKVAVSERQMRQLRASGALGDELALFTTDESETRLRGLRVPRDTFREAVRSAAAGLSPGSRIPLSRLPFLLIRPSTLWFGLLAGRVERSFAGPIRRGAVWHVLFSIHSSHAELRDFVAAVRPRRLVPTLRLSERQMAPFRELLRGDPPSRPVLPPTVARWFGHAAPPEEDLAGSYEERAGVGEEADGGGAGASEEEAGRFADEEGAGPRAGRQRGRRERAPRRGPTASSTHARRRPAGPPGRRPSASAPSSSPAGLPRRALLAAPGRPAAERKRAAGGEAGEPAGSGPSGSSCGSQEAHKRPRRRAAPAPAGGGRLPAWRVRAELRGNKIPSAPRASLLRLLAELEIEAGASKAV